jgi:hypothetical protein
MRRFFTSPRALRRDIHVRDDALNLGQRWSMAAAAFCSRSGWSPAPFSHSTAEGVPYLAVMFLMAGTRHAADRQDYAGAEPLGAAAVVNRLSRYGLPHP